MLSLSLTNSNLESAPTYQPHICTTLLSETIEKFQITEKATLHSVKASSSSFSSFVWYMSWLFYKLVYSTLYIIPSTLITFLSHTFQVTFSLYSLFFFVLIIITVIYAYVRYKYLTIYSRLPQDSKRQDPIIDTFLNSSNDDRKDRTKSYLDEFLSAIKIFGYLDPPVFHELTKSLQTQKLDSGEIIFLDECSGFTICVEGEIQVYCKIGDEIQNNQNLFSKEDSRNVVIVDGIRYQLLNIIKSGAPLSSFIGVLNLLTDTQANIATATPTPLFYAQKSLPLPLDDFYLDPSTKLSTLNSNPTTNPNSHSHSHSYSNQNIPFTATPSKFIPEMIAIPKDNCTISIIPKESFARVALKYPKDTSHIIQMILTKLYRVTFQTAHNYLDLTSDIFQTEINLNNGSSYKLPKYLHDLAIRSLNSSKTQTGESKLKKTFKPSSLKNNNVSSAFSDSSEFLSSTSSLSTPKISRKKYKKSNNRNRQTNLSAPIRNTYLDLLTSDGDESIISTDTALSPTRSRIEKQSSSSSSLRPKLTKNISRHFVLEGRTTTNPGDLLSNVPLPRGKEMELKLYTSKLDMDELKDRTFSAEDEETEESTLRTALAERISKMVGLERSNFPIVQTYNSSIAGSCVNSPTMSGLTGIRAVNTESTNIKSKSHKLRTFSTTSIDINNDNDISSVTSDISKSFVNFENVKKEFASNIKLMKFNKGAKIVKSKEQTPGLYYVIEGSLDVSYLKRESEDSDKYDDRNLDTKKDKYSEEFLYRIETGELAGYLGTLIGSKSFVDVTAATDSYVAFLSREFFEFLIERYPRLQLSIAQHLLKVLDKKVYLADYALEWVHSSAGNTLYLQDDPANGIYIVLNGRFRAIEKLNDKGEYKIISEHGQGESMGEVEVLTKSRRLTTVVAIRDSELARIPRTLFEMIALSNPSIMVNVSRLVATRVSKSGLTMGSDSDFVSTLSPSTHIKDEPLVQNFNNYRTLTLLPVTYGSIPMFEFGEKLANALEKVGKSVKVLNQSSALSSLGKYAFDKLAKLKQGGYFSELEEKYDIIIYLSDAVVNSSWTQTCIQQGDCILLLADSDASPDIGEYERLLVKTKTSARTELVLLHPEKYVEPGMTNKWLKNRIWVHSHHHLQMQCNASHHHDGTSSKVIEQNDHVPLLTRKFTNNLRNKVGNILNNNDFLQFLKQTKEAFKSKKYYQPMQEHKDDFMRLARILTGQAIGLVLGGGGARGLSHVGVVKALEDNGIPVDIIGGTSIGSFVGGLYAKDYDFVPVYGRAKTFASRMSSLWRSVLDLTIPLTSYITGHEFNRGIWKAFGDSRIEDFWIRYYANSTNLTESVMEIHTSGYAWRYIRASMSLASLLPPITDNGNMLLDGGYIDNLTVSEMQRRGVRYVIAVDVGSEDDKSKMDYGDSLSGWWVLLNRMNPFSSHPNVPTMADIQMRLAYVASVNALEKAKKTKGCAYLRPPIEGYATLDFGKFDEIYQVGFKYTDEKVSKLMKEWNLVTRKREVVKDRGMRRRYSL